MTSERALERFAPSADLASIRPIVVNGHALWHDGTRAYLHMGINPDGSPIPMGINPDGSPIPMTVDELNAQIRRSAHAAAAWWAERVRDAKGVGDNGATGGPGREWHLPSMMSMSMAQMARRETNVRPADVDSFETALRDQLVHVMGGGADTTGYPMPGRDDTDPWCVPTVSVILDVDYHPYGILKAALAASSIPLHLQDWAVLPLKTHMVVSARRVAVRAGYGVGDELLRCAWGESDDVLHDYDRRRYWTEQHHRTATLDTYMIERYGKKYPTREETSPEDEQLMRDVGWGRRFDGPIRDVVEDPYPEDVR